ncbi:hypothetical protein [Pseudomonas sp. MN1F]|uniref:hypothetical protein n=1 Tax=Pseudomonas sp. MN1F TaxID=1366632 RepID=UPI00128F8072|nr:hypothetical protein [Pseudomonas sp. MN1F]MQG96224.1 hypothetical protein [Pseudomonas sp. MN1F]
MAKAEKEAPAEGAGQEITAVPDPVQPVTFRDKDYKERVLLMPNFRELRVTRARVVVMGDDSEAIAFLRKRPDFEQQQG